MFYSSFIIGWGIFDCDLVLSLSLSHTYPIQNENDFLVHRFVRQAYDCDKSINKSSQSEYVTNVFRSRNVWIVIFL